MLMKPKKKIVRTFGCIIAVTVSNEASRFLDLGFLVNGGRIDPSNEIDDRIDPSNGMVQQYNCLIGIDKGQSNS